MKPTNQTKHGSSGAGLAYASVPCARHEETAEYDVAVLGGGAIGLIYAIWLKLMRPATTIIVLEQQKSPRHKIGESMLSPGMRSFKSLGLNRSVLRRLFDSKEGLSFWWTDTSSNQLDRYVDVLGLDESVQVERRVLEILLTEHARRHGMEVLQGFHVNLAHSSLISPVKEIEGQRADGTTQRIRARLLCDASGPASLLARHFGYYRREPDSLEPLDTFNANSYFGYFRKQGDLPIPQLDRPATRHLCTPDGWLWFIGIASWEKTPDEVLQRTIQHLLDYPDGEDHTYPTRSTLQRQLGTTCEPIVSIGFVIRNDRDLPVKRSPREMFEYYVSKYPAIQEVMRHYELIEDQYLGYPKGGYKSRICFSHYSTQVTGDGWLMVGDAAFFVNPLISPGLNYGVGTAYLAAQTSVKALDQGDVSRNMLTSYEVYIRSIRQMLFAETDMYHRSFMSRETYERVMFFKFLCGVIDVVPKQQLYHETDPYAYDILNPRYVERVQRIRRALIEREQGIISPTETIQRVSTIVESAKQEILAREDLAAMRLGRFFSSYTDKLERIEQKNREKALVEIVRCSTCKSFADVTIHRCAVCGSKLPEYTSRFADLKSELERVV